MNVLLKNRYFRREIFLKTWDPLQVLHYNVDWYYSYCGYVEFENTYDIRILWKACEKGHLRIVKKLKNIDIDNEDAFIYSAKNGHFHIIKFLYEKGIDLRKFEDVILRVSCAHGYLEIVQYLMDKYTITLPYTIFYTIKPTRHKEFYRTTPLTLSALNGHLHIVQYLVEHGAPISSQWGGGAISKSYATECAVASGCLDIVKYLLEKDNNHIIDIVYLFKSAIYCNQVHIVKYFVEERNILENCISFDGNILSMCSGVHKSLEVLQYFVNIGFDVFASSINVVS